MKFPPIDHPIELGDSMARSKQAVHHILHSIPSMIHSLHMQMGDTRLNGVGSNDKLWSQIDQLNELREFLQDAIK